MRKYRVSVFDVIKLYFLLSSQNAIGKDSEIPGHDERHGLGNFLNATVEISTGLLTNVDKAIPTAQEIFDGPKQLIAGYPFKIIFDVVNKFCSSALQADAIKPKYEPSLQLLNIQLLTACETYAYNLNEAEKLVENTNFDINKKIVIFSTGWNTNPNDTDAVKTVSKAYFCRGDVNFLIYDSTNFIDTLYTWSAFNTDSVGYQLSTFLIDFIKLVPLENIHLIGHSLGAHVVSYASWYYYLRTNKLIPRITGLDPARPCFFEGEVLSGLYRGDAEFIDVIHSNPGVFGKPEPLGDVDFYPNGIGPLAPGCLDISCSHARAWEYYAESVYPGNEKNFMARRCTSLHKLLHKQCAGEEFPMGYAVDKNLKGNYFLAVRRSSPFGMNGTKEQEEQNESCGVCSN